MKVEIFLLLAVSFYVISTYHILLWNSSASTTLYSSTYSTWTRCHRTNSSQSLK